MVEVTDSGEIYAFVVGIGLVHAEEQDLTWEVAYRDFGSQFVLYLAVAPTDNRRLYAVTFNPSDRSQSLITSTDGGESWTPRSEEHTSELKYIIRIRYAVLW